jgi:hypothetical protein
MVAALESAIKKCTGIAKVFFRIADVNERNPYRYYGRFRYKVTVCLRSSKNGMYEISVFLLKSSSVYNHCNPVSPV